jgi:hypothetical protein
VKLVDVAGGQFNELQGDKLEFANTCEAGFNDSTDHARHIIHLIEHPRLLSY